MTGHRTDRMVTAADIVRCRSSHCAGHPTVLPAPGYASAIVVGVRPIGFHRFRYPGSGSCLPGQGLVVTSIPDDSSRLRMPRRIGMFSFMKSCPGACRKSRVPAEVLSAAAG